MRDLTTIITLISFLYGGLNPPNGSRAHVDTKPLLSTPADGELLTWRDRIRERWQRPVEPVDFSSGTLILALVLGLMAVFFVVYPALESFRIGYRQTLGAIVLLAFSLSLLSGLAVSYALLRPLLPRMARGEPITTHDLLLHAFLDIFILSIPLGVYILIHQLVFGGSLQVPAIRDLTQVLFTGFVGYLLGANAVRAAFGLWWGRSWRLAASTGRAPTGR